VKLRKWNIVLNGRVTSSHKLCADIEAEVSEAGVTRAQLLGVFATQHLHNCVECSHKSVPDWYIDDSTLLSSIAIQSYYLIAISRLMFCTVCMSTLSSLLKLDSILLVNNSVTLLFNLRFLWDRCLALAVFAGSPLMNRDFVTIQSAPMRRIAATGTYIPELCSVFAIVYRGYVPKCILALSFISPGFLGNGLGN